MRPKAKHNISSGHPQHQGGDTLTVAIVVLLPNWSVSHDWDNSKNVVPGNIY